MRFIKTNNSIAEFIETDKTGKIISSRGFQFGVIYFEIKNKKVAFYLDNDEQPFQNFVWSTDIPLTIDDVEYETEEEVSAALHSIFNDRFQEQLDQLKEDLAAEEARAQEAEAQLDDKIDDESARAIAAENRLQNQVTELSGAVAVLDNRVTNVENDLSALTDTVNDEITRSVAKDVEHDTLISGLTDDLASEVSRATARENQIDANLNAEIARATNAEDALDTKIDNEITRSTAKDASHDTLISGLTTNLQNEINRATSVENALRNDLNTETSARTNADAAMLERIVAVEVGKADANSVYTKAESDAKYATKDYISGLTDDFFDDVIYDKQSKRINFYNGNRIKAFVDASDFVKDGMVSDVRIVNNNLVITFNTDAGKDAISIPLTDIFDPTNYYTKSEVDSALSSKADKTDVNVISGDVIALSTKVDTISGDIITIQGEIDDIDLTNYYTKGESDGKYQLKGDYVTSAQMSAFTYDKQTIDDKIASGGTFDPTQYYNKTATDALLAEKADTANTYTKSEVNGLVADKADTTALTQVDNVVTAHTANTTVHVTSAEKATWNAKSDFSGSYNDLTNKLSAGTNITIVDNVISAEGGGGGKAIEAGRGISITTGETADTVSFNLAISGGTGIDSLVFGYYGAATAQYSAAFGNASKARGNYAFAIGNGSNANGTSSFAGGDGLAKAIATGSFAFGYNPETRGTNSVALGGYFLRTENESETALGKANVSHTGSTDGDKTLFSVGNGTSTSARHNAFEIRQNGDIYISSGGTDILLQDNLGGGGGSSYTAGDGIDITNDVISVTGKVDTSAFTAHTADTTIHVTSAEKATWNAKADASNVYTKTEVDNKLSLKPNVWCGDESEWSQISGSTESGTIYLVY